MAEVLKMPRKTRKKPPADIKTAESHTQTFNVWSDFLHLLPYTIYTQNKNV